MTGRCSEPSNAKKSESEAITSIRKGWFQLKQRAQFATLVCGAFSRSLAADDGLMCPPQRKFCHPVAARCRDSRNRGCLRGRQWGATQLLALARVFLHWRFSLGCSQTKPGCVAAVLSRIATACVTRNRMKMGVIVVDDGADQTADKKSVPRISARCDPAQMPQSNHRPNHVPPSRNAFLVEVLLFVSACSGPPACSGALCGANVITSKGTPSSRRLIARAQLRLRCQSSLLELHEQSQQSRSRGLLAPFLALTHLTHWSMGVLRLAPPTACRIARRPQEATRFLSKVQTQIPPRSFERSVIAPSVWPDQVDSPLVTVC